MRTVATYLRVAVLLALLCQSGFELAAQTSAGLTPGLPVKIDGIEAEPGNRQITLRWAAPKLPVQGFDHRMSTDGGKTWTGWQTATSLAAALLRTRVVTGLANGMEYTFEVRARDAGRFGPASSVRAIAGLPGTPEPPSTALGDGRVDLHGWLAEAHGSPMQAYLVHSSTVGTTLLADFDDQRWEAMSSALSNGDRYQFRVQALNDVGAGRHSLAVEATPSDALPPAPKGLEAVTGARGGWSLVTLSWNQDPDGAVAFPADGFAGLPTGAAVPGVTGYEYRRRRMDFQRWWPNWTAVPGGATVGILEIPGLWFGTRYVFEVRATGADGPGAVSATTAIPAIQGNEDNGPWGFVAEWTHSNQVELVWGSPPLLLLGTYEYRRSGDYGTTWGMWTEAVAHCEGICFTMVPLGGARAHRFLFQLRKRGETAISEAWTGPHPEAPGAPVHAEATTSGSGRVTLRWNSSGSGSPATAWEYRSVFLDAPDGSAWTDWTAIQPTAMGDNGYEFAPVLAVAPQIGRYAIQVRGTNAHGAGAGSNIAMAEAR